MILLPESYPVQKVFTPELKAMNYFCEYSLYLSSLLEMKK